MRRLFLHAALLLALSGCSIKEDRSICQCRLLLDFSGTDASLYDSLHVNVMSSEGFRYKGIVYNTGFGDIYGVSVPRNGVYLNVYNGRQDSFLEGRGFIVPLGEDLPELFIHSGYYDTGNETCNAKVVLRKCYCKVRIHMVADGTYPFSLGVEGNVCGYGPDGRPCAGLFSYSAIPDDGGYFIVDIPRQTDASLKLKISEDGNVLREFALGEYIIESGYDWSAPDLADIEIEVDYSKTDVVFKVEDWEKTVSFDVII